MPVIAGDLIAWAQVLTQVLAVMASPLIALWLSKRLDFGQQRRRRREEILHLLFRHRPTRDILPPQFMEAMNVIPVEFNDDPEVLTRREEFFESVRREDPETEKTNRMVTLLLAVGRSLKYEFTEKQVRDVFLFGARPGGG